MNSQVDPKISIIIACHNNLDVLKHSIPSVYDESYSIVLFDDGSTDGTYDWVKFNYPRIKILLGDGNYWWTGSVAKCVDYCLKQNTDYIVSVNADVLVTPASVKRLVKRSQDYADAVIASLVVDVSTQHSVMWGGSRFQRVNKFLPVYASRYVYKAGHSVAEIPKGLYEVDEVHGRGVVIPASVIKKLGNYDGATFPQYGGDTEYSFRMKKNNIKMFVDPSSVAKVFSENTSILTPRNENFEKKVINILRYLFKRKNGEAAILWWRLYWRYLPKKFFIQSYIFVLGLNILRRLR